MSLYMIKRCACTYAAVGFLSAVAGCVIVARAMAAEPVVFDLSKSIRTALEQNLGYERSRQALALSQSAVRSAKGRFLPQVAVTSDYTGNRNERTNETDKTASAGVGVTERLVTGASVSADVSSVWQEEENAAAGADDYFTAANISFRQPLLRGGLVKVATAPLVKARRSLSIDDMALSLEAQQLVVNVYSGYYGLVKEELIRGTRRIELDIANQSLKGAKIMKGLGDASGLDVSQAQLRVSQAQDSLESQISKLETVRDAFRVLLHIDQNVAFELDENTEITTDDVDKLVKGESTGTLVEEFTPRKVDPESMVAAALKNRIEIQQAKLRSENSLLNEEVARNGKGPSFDVVAQFNVDDSGTGYERSLSLRRPRYLYGFEFSYPIGNISEKEAYTSARINRRLSEISEAQVRENIIQEVRDRVRRVQLTEQRVKLIKQGLEVAAFSYNGNRIRYEAGEIDFRLFSDAQRDLINQLIDYFSVLMDYKIENVRLDKATGQLDLGKWSGQ